MRKGTWLRSALLVLALAGAALGAEEARLDRARTLLEQAKPLARVAEDTELEAKERSDARGEALKLLKQARDEFQAWQTANGEDADDPIGREIGMLLYWLKKMSGISDPRLAPPAPREPATPPPPKDETATPPAPPDPAQVAKDDFAKLQELEKSLRADPAALKDEYERFLADHPDPSLPEYTQAATRLGQLQEELNAKFKEVVARDPDEIANIDSSATPAVMARLKRELQSGDPAARKNAARLLGLTRSGAASYALISVLMDDDREVADLAAESLVAIGGRRAAENLTKSFRDRSPASQAVALGVLERIAQKGPVDADAMSYWIGRFGLSNDREISERAAAFLQSLGVHGGPGIVEMLDQTRNDQKKLWAIDAVARIRYHRGASKLCTLLLRGDGRIQILRSRAIEAIKSMGVPTVPFLIGGLRDGRTRDWTAAVLRDVTGEKYGASDIGKWKEWWLTVGSRSGK